MAKAKRKRKRKRAPVSPKAVDDAVAFFEQRVAVTPEQLKRLRGSAKDRAFTVANAAQLELVQSVLDSISRSVRDGTGFDQFRKEVRTKLLRAWGRANPHQIEAIWRTEVQRAFTAGRFRQLTQQNAINLRPFWIFDAVLDSRTSAICKSNNNTIRRWDDAYWDDHYPPLHFNCRSNVRAMRRSDVAAAGGPTPKRKANRVEEPAKGFGKSPGATFKDAKPDLSKADKALLKSFKRKQRKRKR